MCQAQKYTAPPPAEEAEGLWTCAAARKWKPTQVRALRGAAQERRWLSNWPELKSHTVTPASTAEHTTTTSLTVASLLHPPTAPRPSPSQTSLSQCYNALPLLLLLLLHTSPRATPASFVDTDHENSLQPSPPPSNSSPLTFKWPASSFHKHTLTTDLHSNSAGCAPMYVSYVMSMVMMFIFRL